MQAGPSVMMRSRYLGDKQIPLLRLLGTMPRDPPPPSHMFPHILPPAA